jgi:hypothetical protein
MYRIHNNIYIGFTCTDSLDIQNKELQKKSAGPFQTQGEFNVYVLFTLVTTKRTG